MLEFDLVYSNYAAAKRRLGRVPAANDNVAVAAVRRDLPNVLGQVIAGRVNSNDYKVTGSVGEYPLNMATIPWVAIWNAPSSGASCGPRGLALWGLGRRRLRDALPGLRGHHAAARLQKALQRLARHPGAAPIDGHRLQPTYRFSHQLNSTSRN